MQFQGGTATVLGAEKAAENPSPNVPCPFVSQRLCPPHRGRGPSPSHFTIPFTVNRCHSGLANGRKMPTRNADRSDFGHPSTPENYWILPGPSVAANFKFSL
jgi:hypothetical protein